MKLFAVVLQDDPATGVVGVYTTSERAVKVAEQTIMNARNDENKDHCSGITGDDAADYVQNVVYSASFMHLSPLGMQLMAAVVVQEMNLDAEPLAPR
jgi:hypothetical protein